MAVDKCFFSDFGADAVVGGVTCRVIFDNDFLASVGVESSNPVALVRDADVPAVAQGDVVSISVGSFSPAFSGSVVAVQPDGTGTTMLELRAS